MFIYLQEAGNVNIVTRGWKCEYIYKRQEMLIYLQEAGNVNIVTRGRNCY